MNYLKYIQTDVVNGEGTRSTLFVAGCSHHCTHCYNKSSLNPKAGFLFDEEMTEQIISDLKDTRIKRRGLSLSGGDPLFEGNLDAISRLVTRVKEECPDKDIWMWTGYKLEELDEKRRQIVSKVDVLIDGKFERDKYDPSLKWRGSSNQVIHRFTDL
ncbi:anaerobic ribonucleoside-triphosphate reductase-activating protein [Vibrio sp. D431a]|uniref:anaerobic ribonucleoside-triphosphate reductase-activating protein n=1 Tax=Vibrio sp. D431a TaxID=2837388 RepID=UPI0025534038|nr:anaerobic ribonucleoside-triphosphate reductase-activating protein [Vibrio sp. D431a]MDK9793257.1 anaerobic ribonucleoside-triphosphate reductase-activating protein [Vibrio sp. D431a]